MKSIYLLTTGGTIEKVYSEQTGGVANVSSKIERYLALLRLPDAEVNIVPLMNKDSLEMTDADLAMLLGMVRAVLRENAPICSRSWLSSSRGSIQLMCDGRDLACLAIAGDLDCQNDCQLPVVRQSDELCLARHFFDIRLPQSLPNIDANLLNGIVPIAEPIPLWRVGLCSACHIRRPGGNHNETRPLKAGDKLPPLPAVPLPFAH